jgi:hypothetical protein
MTKRKTKVVDEVDALEQATESHSGRDFDCFYDDNGGYWENEDEARSRFFKRSENQLKRALKKRRLRDKPDRDKGEVMSEIESFLERVEMKSRVFYAAPLSGYRAGLVTIQGEPALITRTHQLIEPKIPSEGQRVENPECPGFPIYYGLTKRMFDDEEDGVFQLHYWLGWLQHALESLYTYRPTSGLALAIAGDPNCGKTLQTDLLAVMFGGRSAKPYDWMIGRDNFNPEIAQCALLLIDDEAADGSHKARNNLKAQVKKFVANSSVRIRGMHTPAIDVKFFARLVFLLNLEESNVIVLPPVDGDLADKMMLLKAYKHSMPMPTRRISERQRFWEALMEEIPHFLWWILNEYELPEEYWPERDGRYYVKPYCHPEIASMLHCLSRSSQTWELIQKHIFSQNYGSFKLHVKGVGQVELPKGVWIGSATDLVESLERQDMGKSELAMIPKANFIGRDLSECQKYYGDKQVRFLGRNKDGSSRLWLLCDKGRFDDIFGGKDLTALTESFLNTVKLEVNIEQLLTNVSDS